MKIQLLQNEYDFLINEKFLDQRSIELLKKNINKDLSLDIDDDSADTIRDACGEYLQDVGFDKDYNPTEKGVLLECLIDKFFIG